MISEREPGAIGSMADWYNTENGVLEAKKTELQASIAGRSDHEIANDGDVRELTGRVEERFDLLASFAARMGLEGAEQAGEFDPIPPAEA